MHTLAYSSCRFNRFSTGIELSLSVNPPSRSTWLLWSQQMDSPPLISQPTTCDDLSQEEAQRTSIRSLQKFNAFLLKQNEQLEKRCNDLQRQNDQFSEAILQHASAYWKEWQLIRGGHRISAPSVPEGLAEREWRVLKDSVRNFVTQLLSQTLTLDDAKRLIRESNIQMTQLEKMAESMVEDSRLCPIWLRSWVWHVLYYSIFNTQWWGGTHGETFGLLLKTLSGKDNCLRWKT